MRRLKLAVFCTAGLLLAGCQPTREQLAMQANQDNATCRSYGAKPGTDGMVNCRVALMQSREAERRRKAAAVDDAIDAYLIGTSLGKSPTRTCNSTPNGVGGMTMTCF